MRGCRSHLSSSGQRAFQKNSERLMKARPYGQDSGAKLKTIEKSCGLVPAQESLSLKKKASGK